MYALIDSCAPNDLQYLHTVFGGKCPFVFLLVTSFLKVVILESVFFF